MLDENSAQGSSDKGVFAHYTSSKALGSLPDSDFNVVGPVQLVVDYHIAPKFGELFAGGTQGLLAGRDVALTSLGGDRYRPHDEMISSYTVPEESFRVNFFNSSAEIKESFNSEHFLNEKLLKLAIQAQTEKLPNDLDHHIKSIEENLDKAVSRFESAIPVFYVMSRFVAFHGKMTEDDHKAVVNHMIEKIRSNNELKRLVSTAIREEDSNQIDDDILKELNILFGRDDTIKNIKTDESAVKRVVDFFEEEGEEQSIIDNFIKKSRARIVIASKSIVGEQRGQRLKSELTCYIKGSRNIEKILDIVTDIEIFNDNDRDALKEKLKELEPGIDCVKQTVAKVKDILSNPNLLKASEVPTCFSKPFPVAFIVKGEDKSLRDLGNEFRADTLTLGHDVKTIAVPEAHREEVKQFLTDHHLQNAVRVCDLDLLKQNMNSSDFDNVLSSMSVGAVHRSQLPVIMVTSVNDVSATELTIEP